MAHEIVALKWRPRLFSEVIGQEHITETLTYALSSGRIAPVYLFTGIRGTGKTTLARIMVKSLNCTNRTEDGEPCNECNSCRETMAGRNPDIIEIDGASHNTVDDVRSLKETISYGPVNSVYRAYIIDEVHMLSRSAFNALLKTLEEPPPNTVFILATTDPQKIPPTVLSRCQRYDLKRLMIEQITQQLKKILESENVRYDDNAVYTIAREGEGSMRDAQTLLEQMITFSEGEITMTQVSVILGSSESTKLRQLIEAIITGDVKTGVETVREIYRDGKSLEKAALDMLHLMHGIVLTVELKDVSLLDAPKEEVEWMQSVVTKGTRADWLRLFRFWSQEIDKIRSSDFTTIMMEVAVITATSFPTMNDLRGLYELLKNDNKIAELSANIDDLSRRGTPRSLPVEKAEEVKSPSVSKQAASLDKGEQLEKVEPEPKPEPEPEAKPEPEPAPVMPVIKPQPVPPKTWSQFLLLLKKEDALLWAIFHTVEYDEIDSEVHLFLHSIKEEILQNQKATIDTMFTAFFKTQKTVVWHLPKKGIEAAPTGSSQFQRNDAEHKKEVETKKNQIRQSDTVKKLEQLEFTLDSVRAK